MRRTLFCGLFFGIALLSGCNDMDDSTGNGAVIRKESTTGTHDDYSTNTTGHFDNYTTSTNTWNNERFDDSDLEKSENTITPAESLHHHGRK